MIIHVSKIISISVSLRSGHFIEVVWPLRPYDPDDPHHYYHESQVVSLFEVDAYDNRQFSTSDSFWIMSHCTVFNDMMLR